jgi:hypothetical protein
MIRFSCKETIHDDLHWVFEVRWLYRICEPPKANEVASTKRVREQEVGCEQGARTEERR